MMNLTRLARLAISEEGFAFDPTTGESFALNQTGLTVLRGLLCGQPQAEIIETLANEFDRAPREVERDCMDFINHLTTQGLA